MIDLKTKVVSVFVSLYCYNVFLGLTFRNFSRIKHCGDNDHRQALALSNFWGNVGALWWELKLKSNKFNIIIVQKFCGMSDVSVVLWKLRSDVFRCLDGNHNKFA
jgi:hypothetical protein